MNSVSTFKWPPQVSSVPVEAIAAYQTAQSVWKFYSPVIIVLGTFGNVMSIIVMRRMTSDESTVNIFFMVIAVADMGVLYTGILRGWVEAYFGYYLQTSWPLMSYFLSWVTYCSGFMASWTLVCVTLQRALSVVWPHRVSHVFTRRKVKVVLCGLAVFTAVLYSHYLFGVHIPSPVHSADWENGNTTSSIYTWFLDDVFSYIDLALFSVLPFMCMAFGNAVLVFQLKTAVRKTRNTLTETHVKQNLARRKVTNSVTITVLVVSLTYIILTLPGCVYLILIQHNDSTERTGQEEAEAFLFYTATFLTCDSNSAINFYLYCLTGRRFRQEFVKVMGCRGKRSQGNTSESPVTTVSKN